MYDISSPDFWVVAVAGLVIGLFIGWVVSSLVQRRANAGANVTQLRKEMEDYREEVNTHFARTAELFRDTTEKYRDLYEHLAGGAQELCDDLPDRARVEFRPGHLLPASQEETEQAQQRDGAPAKAAVAGADKGNAAGAPKDKAPESPAAPSAREETAGKTPATAGVS